MTSHFRRFLPTLNRVLIQKVEAQKKTSPIILSTKEPPTFIGKIVAIGEGARNDKGNLIPVSVKIGSTVLLPEYGGQKVELKDGEFYLYRDTEIMGILEDPVN